LEKKHGTRYRSTPEAELEKGQTAELLALYREELFVGPLPHPELLAGYERACPGSAQRIIEMTERQGEHRRELEQKIVEANIHSEKRGQFLAFVLALLICGGGIYLLAQGRSVVGLVALLTPLAGLAGLFLTSLRRTSEVKPAKESQRRSPEGTGSSLKQPRDPET
jgi:uncharacterized membrane protein